MSHDDRRWLRREAWPLAGKDPNRRHAMKSGRSVGTAQEPRVGPYILQNKRERALCLRNAGSLGSGLQWPPIATRRTGREHELPRCVVVGKADCDGPVFADVKVAKGCHAQKAGSECLVGVPHPARPANGGPSCVCPCRKTDLRQERRRGRERLTRAEIGWFPCGSLEVRVTQPAC